MTEKQFKKGDLINIKLSAPEFEVDADGKLVPFADDFVYYVSLSYYLNDEKDLFCTSTYYFDGEEAEDVDFNIEVTEGLANEMKDFGISKYTVTNFDFNPVEGRGSITVSIDEVKEV